MLRLAETYEEAEEQGLLWTPAMLAGGLKAWADFGDLPLLGLVSGDARAVRDKGLMGSWAYVGAGPTYSAAALNNRAAVGFASGDSLVTDTAADCTPPMVATVIMALTGSTQGNGRILGIAATGANDYDTSSACALILRNGWNNEIMVYYAGAARAYATLAFGSPHIVSIEISAAGAVTFYVDGVSAGTGSGITGTSWTAVRGLIACLKTDGSGEDLDGPFGEAVIFAGPEYQRARHLVEGYMAWRWRLPTLLGAGHPYRSTAPLIGG